MKHIAPMTPQRIDTLIARRNKLTSRRDGLIDWKYIARIDKALSEVPAGERNDVDLLLGRSCAKLPTRPGYFVNPAITLEAGVPQAEAMVKAYRASLSAADIAQMQAMCDEQRTEAPSHDGMWK